MGAKKGKKIRWTPEEEKFLIENFKKMTYDEIAKHLGRSHWAISMRVQKLNLLDREYVDSNFITRCALPSFMINIMIGLSLTIVILAIALFMVVTWLR